MERPEMLNRKKSPGSNALLFTVCALLIALLLLDLLFVRRFVVVEVDGSSMENTVFDGDFVYADREKSPERGDVVIIDVSARRVEEGFEGDYIIKRLIATEGDTVKCESGVVFVRHAGEKDFVALDESYVNGRTSDFGETTVGEGEIFFLGDHRTVSKDSRTVGCFPASAVVGVVPEWSVDHKDLLKLWENFRSRFGTSGTRRR